MFGYDGLNLPSSISIVRVHGYIQSQTHRDVVRKAGQLGYVGHRFNFLNGNKEDRKSVCGSKHLLEIIRISSIFSFINFPADY